MEFYIGIDIGGTNVKLGISHRDGSSKITKSIKSLATRPWNEVLDDICNAVHELINEAKITKDDVKAIGIGCPGYIDSKNGIVIYSNNINWNNVPITSYITNKIGIPSFVTNDANIAALGEHAFGSASNYNSSIMITLGTGVGSGIIINNEIFEGYKSCGTEFGHIKIGDKGHQCTCGRIDCWEQYSSATALIRDTKEAMMKDSNSLMWKFVNGDINKTDGRTSFECAKKGDATALEVVREYIKTLGDGLLNVWNTFAPEIILIGGGVCGQGDYLLEPLKIYVNKNKYGGDMCPEVKISIASLGNNAGWLGGIAYGATQVAKIKEKK